MCLAAVHRLLMFIVVVAAAPENCSFPYTYNGGLYYSCIENMAGVSTAQQPLACITVNATPANCDCPGSFVLRQLKFHNWWLLRFITLQDGHDTLKLETETKPSDQDTYLLRPRQHVCRSQKTWPKRWSTRYNDCSCKIIYHVQFLLACLGALYD